MTAYKNIELISYTLLFLYIIFIGIIIYNPKTKLSKKQIISILVLLNLLILIKNYFDKELIFFFFFILCTIYYKITYKNKINLALYSTLVLNIILIISKLILNLFFYQKNFNLIQLILSFVITLILRKKIILLTHNYRLIKNTSLISFFAINIYSLSIINNPKLVNIQNILIIIILSTIILLLIIIEEKFEYLKRTNQELVQYNKSIENDIASYQKAQHEYKNKLIIIKSMINDNKKLIEYVDYLIDEPIILKNKWLNYLKFIPFPEIKNFINYKMNILENKNAQIELFVGEELNDINPNNVSITDINNIDTIIGVMLDNMIESIEITENKLISINIYIDKNILHVLLANSIEKPIDLNQINTLGYSTKGKKRGEGLSIVTDIIKANKKMELETKIEENFFIQHLKIKNIKKYLK